MKSDCIKNFTSVMRKCEIPTIIKGFFTEISTETCNISVIWGQNCFDTNEKILYETGYAYRNEKLEKLTTFPSVRQKYLLECISPSFSKRGMLKKSPNNATQKEEHILEIWSQNRNMFLKSINLSAPDKHGDIHSDSVFSSFMWSSDESKILYLAERKKTKTCTFFDRILSEEASAVPGEKFNYEESWGEQLTEIINPVICILDVSSETINVIDIPEDICPAQPQWGPENSIIFAGLQKFPFRLGRIYCENRISDLYKINLEDNEVINLSEDGAFSSICYPRISNCGSKVAFLKIDLQEEGNPHRNAEELFVHDLANNIQRKVPVSFNGKSVPLFSHDLPTHCWLQDNKHVALPLTIDGMFYAALINTDNGAVVDTISCSAVHSVQKNFILTSHTKLNPAFVSLQLSQYCEPSNDVKTISEEQVKDTDICYGTIRDEHGIVSHYIMPTKTNMPLPVVVYPHGGPHSVYTDNFNFNARRFCKLGYAVLLVNYRGSTGFSVDSLHSLSGKVGTQDVKDVQNFAQKFLEDHGGKLDSTNVFVYGGSHGGFLGAHLIGQYPKFYRAAALINPVIDMAAKSLVTDIPDWNYYESGLPYRQDTLPTSDAYKSMLEKSPIVYIKNIEAPVLLCIGEKDRRVPPSQGKGYHRLLKGNDKVTKLLLYPDDCHPLSSVETTGDCFINVCKWFEMYRIS